MTLVTTEIHNHDDSAHALIVFAADRRISTNAGRALAAHKKVYELPWLNAGIGYFGLAQVSTGRSMQDWLKSFISRSVDCHNLEDFAKALTDALNTTVPSQWRRREPSGFHIAGFVSGKPEFWFVRNVDDDGKPTSRGYECREDFQRRDVKKSKPGEVGIYRNGDLRAHEAVWTQLDISLGALLRQPGFKQIRKPPDYVNWVVFKMEVIAYFYKSFYKKSIIGRPIDAFAITPKRPSG
jgi:hypothetical protein